MPSVSGNSDVKAAPGVNGVNSADGDGVFGRGPGNGRGVVGVSDNHTGVEGNSTNGFGVFGSSKTHEGVIGVTDSSTFAAVSGISNSLTGTSAGVWGKSKAFEGVHGESESATFAAMAGVNVNPDGTGVFGKGGRFAGFFEGNVAITGEITVRGLLLLQRMQQLEQQIANHESRIRELESRMGSGGGSGSTQPLIQLSLNITTQDFRDLVITGSRFQPAESVSLQITTDEGPGHNPFTVTQATTADATGRIDVTTGVRCASLATSFEVLATGNVTGMRSNVATINCV